MFFDSYLMPDPIYHKLARRLSAENQSGLSTAMVWHTWDKVVKEARSATRTFEEQKRLHDEWMRRHPRNYAIPGESDRSYPSPGLAIDVDEYRNNPFDD